MDEKRERRIMLDVLEDMTLSLESLKRNAWDNKTFYSGYHKCAVDFSEIIRLKILDLEDENELLETKVEEENKMESPLVVESE